MEIFHINSTDKLAGMWTEQEIKILAYSDWNSNYYVNDDRQ